MRQRSRLSSPLRAALAVVVTAVLAASGARAADDPDKVPADPPLHPVLDPHYGDVLFEFFQDDYFPAITGLMVSQHFDRVAHHADEAEVLRGGLLLSYGLHEQASDVFEQLIARGAAPSVRDRAWYYLAKIRYQRGYLAQAEEAIARIESHLPAELQEERGLLQANLLMARADYAGAANALSAMDGKAAGVWPTVSSSALPRSPSPDLISATPRLKRAYSPAVGLDCRVSSSVAAPA